MYMPSGKRKFHHTNQPTHTQWTRHWFVCFSYGGVAVQKRKTMVFPASSMVILKKLDNSTRSQKDFIMQPWAIKQSKIKLLHNVIVEQESGLI